MQPRRTALVLLGLALLAVPVAAHGNYVSADPQVSADGTVRVEFGFLVTDGFVVLHLDNASAPGEPVGHGEVDGYQLADHAVAVEPAAWANLTGSFDLWVVLHRDSGDGQFVPEDDPPLRSPTDDVLIADRIAVRKAVDGPVNVIAEREAPQKTGQNRVTLRTVRLATDGYVVIRADADGSPGPVVGHRALPAGEHGPVNVTLDPTFYERRPEAFALWAVVHRDDGDGAFDAAADPAVQAGDARVMTRFSVERTDPIEHTPTPAPTATAAVTATPTTAGHGEHDHEHTKTPTAGSHEDHEHTAATTSSEPTTAGAHDHEAHDHESPAPTATPGQPGFGPVVAFGGLLAAVLLARRRFR